MGNQNHNCRPRGNSNFGDNRGTRSREPVAQKYATFVKNQDTYNGIVGKA